MEPMEVKPTLSITSLTDLFRPSFKRLHPFKLSQTRLELLKHDIQTDVHLISLGELYTRLDTNPDIGLTSTRAVELRAYYGPNKLTPPTTVCWLHTFLTSMCNRFTFLLWIAAILSFVAFFIGSLVAARRVLCSHHYCSKLLLKL